jgi:signal transduction histidine kinase
MLLSFAAGVIAVIAVVYMCVDVGVYHNNYRDTGQYQQQVRWDSDVIFNYYELLQKAETESTNEQELEGLRNQIFPPAGTSLAWVLIDSSGNTLLTNTEGWDDALDYVATLTGREYMQIRKGSLFVLIGMRKNLEVEDVYSRGLKTFNAAKHWFLPTIIAGSICILLCMVLFGFMVSAVGHKEGVEGIVLNAFDRIWLEPLVAFQFLLVFVLLFTLSDYSSSIGETVTTCAFMLISSLIVFFSIVRRAKAGMLFKTTFIYLIVRIIKAIAFHMPLMLRVIICLAGYGILQLILLIMIVNGSFLASLFWLISNIGMVVLVCLFAIQIDNIKKAAERMAAGQFGHLIKRESVPFFTGIADNLNSTGNAMSLSVERAMQSERMKTELIANVSHDIKTPLTSIISYVDLLKTTDIKDKKALEYIDILDKKSRRLGQLMTDLVEASKVTSGNISVNIEQINLGELLKQAGAEVEPRLENRGISLVCTLPEAPVWVYADGRHMWRVLDNLFSNAAKYALDGTRVYVDVSSVGSEVILSVKNISRDALNMPPDELMERFVRGDKSRYTEGSGLGLSIARNLMEMQHGTMNIFIDGDLFKVVLTLKSSEPPVEPQE